VAETDTLKMIYINFRFQSVKLLLTVRSSAFLSVPQTQYYLGKVDEKGGKCGTLGRRECIVDKVDKMKEKENF
jgi:hypothetical protein